MIFYPDNHCTPSESSIVNCTTATTKPAKRSAISDSAKSTISYSGCWWRFSNTDITGMKCEHSNQLYNMLDWHWNLKNPKDLFFIFNIYTNSFPILRISVTQRECYFSEQIRSRISYSKYRKWCWCASCSGMSIWNKFYL